MDAVFEQPWAYDAEGVRLRHAVAHSEDEYSRVYAQMQLSVWSYKDAYGKGATDEAARLRRGFSRSLWESLESRSRATTAFGLYRLVSSAVEMGDLQGAAEELLDWHPLLDFRALEEDNARRTDVRNFISACTAFLGHAGSIGFPLEIAVDEAMMDAVERAESVLTVENIESLKGVRRRRARTYEASRLEQRDLLQTTTESDEAGLSDHVRRTVSRRDRPRGDARSASKRVGRAEHVIASVRKGGPPDALAGVIGDLVTVLSEPGLARAVCLRAATALADAALVVNQVHDDPAALLSAAARLDQFAATADGRPVRSLAHMLKARAAMAALRDQTADAHAHIATAVAEWNRAAANADDLTEAMLPEIHSALARLLVFQNPDEIDTAIESCRTGRRHGLRRWRAATAADTTLARLLVWRALRPDTAPEDREAMVDEAIRLSRRQSRPWHAGGARARLALNEALSLRDALSGGADQNRRAADWRKAERLAGGASTGDRLRVAEAWVAWSVGTGDADLIAEAYERLVSAVPLHAATRYRSAAKDEVIAGAQEHTEEAGYWLSRARRYRDAVVALETGRAVKLSEITARDRASMVDLLTRIGDPSLAARLANALATLDDEERGASAPSGSSTHLQQAWADVTAAARAIATATGTDPLALAVDYDDVTAATADGAVVYIAAAKAGGYALVVASGHDPQFVDLPRFDRATIERLLDAFLPRQGKKPPSPDRRAAGLKWLWDNGMRDLMLDHARGRVVTLVPVGLLGLVPLHAAGDPGDPDVLREEWRHASHFSAVRYAPNARALRWGRETADHLSGPELSLFAASVQRGHGSRSPLFAVVDETNDVARTWKAGTTTPHHECTWAEFRENAPEHNVWHLACHGRAIPDAILASTLHFSDSAVTLRQMLADFGLAPRRLAVLSACESHMTGIANPNEAIGLPSAMIQLGFAGVIAAAWPTSDLATGYLMARFHRYWRQEGDAPVIALTRAQQWLRRATRSELTALLPGLSPILEMFAEEDARPFADPVYWAAFAYTGV